jgi:hypothetical protein
MRQIRRGMFVTAPSGELAVSRERPVPVHRQIGESAVSCTVTVELFSNNAGYNAAATGIGRRSMEQT